MSFSDFDHQIGLERNTSYYVDCDSPEIDFSLITINTTQKEFDAMYTINDCRTIRNCWNAVGAAAACGNVPLVEHIVKRGGEGMLKLGNNCGETPLFTACIYNQYDTAKKLIELGADINGAFVYPRESFDVRKTTPVGANPLWAALEKTNNSALVKLLLRREAIAAPPLSDQAKVFAEHVGQELKKELEKAIDSCDLFAPELNKIIADYAHYAPK